MKKTVATLIAALCAAGPQAGAATLDVRQFLEQVKAANTSVQGALRASAGAEKRAVEGSLLFSPRLFANASTYDDRRETVMPASQGDETQQHAGVVGIAQVARFGLMSKLSYGLTSTRISGVNPLYIQRPDYTDSSVTLELSQPLWQNRGGRQYKNYEILSAAQAQARAAAKVYEAQMLLLGAEAKFWKLAAVRESMGIIRTSLERTQRILDFNTRKASRGLTDISDVYQAEAMVRARQLDLAQARSQEKEAMRDLNVARNSDGDTVAEDVLLPGLDAVLGALTALPAPADMRNDVKAAEQGLAAVQAANEVSVDKTLPEVRLYALGSLNARGKNSQDAMDDSFNSDHPLYTVGLTLSVPLDRGKTGAVRTGYAAEIAGATQQYEQQKRDQDREWKTLAQKIADIKESLAAADLLEKAQGAKLEKEREKQQMGRSTMFQVFAFEQEHLASQLNLINLKCSAMVLLAQAKTFMAFENTTGALP